MKKIIISIFLVIVGLMTISQVAFADSAVLSGASISGTSTIGSIFNISVQVDPANNKVCVVKGTISLANLACQNISLASGVMAQTAPTCSAPSFIIGIPKCTTVLPQNLFNVSVVGVHLGQASSSFTGVKVIGVGVDVPFTSPVNSYNIIAVGQSGGGSHRNIATTTVVNYVPNPIKPLPIIVGSSTDLTAASSTTTTSKNIEQVSSRLSMLSASVLEAFSSAINFIKENWEIILFLLLVVLTISQVLMWIRILRKKE